MAAAQEETEKPFSAIVTLIQDTLLALNLLLQIRSDLLHATFISQHLYSSTKKLVTFLIPTRFLRDFHWLLFAVRINFLILRIIMTIGLYLTNICKLVKSITDIPHLCSCICLQAYSTLLRCHKREQTGVGGIIKIPPSIRKETELSANFLIRKSKCSKPTASLEVLPVYVKHLTIYGIKMNKLEAFTTEKFATLDKVIYQ